MCASFLKSNKLCSYLRREDFYNANQQVDTTTSKIDIHVQYAVVII